MNAQLMSPDYRGDLGNGLICRWSTIADCEKIGNLMGTVFRNPQQTEINVRAADEARIFMSDGFPWAGAGDIAIVEDSSKAEKPVVACLAVWQHRWSYGGIEFGVGRPENVASDPAYRNRGLVRALMEMFHARSEARGDLVQAITGIPFYYRQFGYEYVLDLSHERAIPISAIAEKKTDEVEPYQLRQAKVDDVPALMQLYNQRRNDSLVWHEVDEHYWRYHIDGWSDCLAGGRTAIEVGFYGPLYMIEDREQQVCGYLWPAAKRWGETLQIFGLQLAKHVNWQVAFPSLLRLLRQYGEGVPGVKADTAAFSRINFYFGGDDPIRSMIDDRFISNSEPPYAWYLRVPDVPAFVRLIAPVLEERLANSILVSYSGELRFDFYRGGLRIAFVDGKLVSAEPWQSPVDAEQEHGGCPPLTFLQLLFGYRSLDELRQIFPDVWVKSEAELLISTLFPKQPSTVKSLSYT